MIHMEKADVLVVGAGISGLTVAERIASQLEKSVLVIDKRNHIGGNCYDFYNKQGLLVPLYGPHYFHTNLQEVVDYLSNFTDWILYEPKLLSNVEGNIFVPVPVNINTVNILFDENLKNEKEMEIWLKKEIKLINDPKNSEDIAVSTMGNRLYEKLIKNYIKKQWGLWPYELRPEIVNRIPVRKNIDDRCFLDKYQLMPKEGYTKMFENMIEKAKIKVKLNTNFFELNEEALRNFKKIIFTGRIDSFFNGCGLDSLQYRSLIFNFEDVNTEFFQKADIVVYPNSEKFTRITEPKHATGQKNSKTTIIKEYPCWDGEAYYPVPSERNEKLYNQYKYLAEKIEQKGIYFVGRLAEYKYFDMDKAFKNALNFFERVRGKFDG